MTSEGNKAAAPNEPLPIEPLASSGAKRKRGRPRKYEYSTYEQPHMAQPIQSIPPLRSALYNPNIRHDGVHINHTLGGTLDTKMHTVYVLPAQQTQGDRSSRPVDSGNPVQYRENQASNSNSSGAHVRGNLGKDVIIGKHFVGKMTKQHPGFSLITVRVKDNQVLRGWIPDETNLRPITPKDDLAPDLPMLQPSRVQKKASAIHRQAAPPLPVHLENVTIAKPLQMRRPVETSTAKHVIPPVPRPYVGPGVVAAAPVSVISVNASRPLPKQDTASLSQEPSATAVPVKPAEPVLVSCRHVDQDVNVEGKSVPEFNSDSESSSGSKESSGQTPRGFPAAMDETEITSGSKEHSNIANSDQHICKEPSDNPEQSDERKTESNILKGVDGSMTGASGTTPAAEASSATPNPLDDVQSAIKEDKLKVDSEESRLTTTT